MRSNWAANYTYTAANLCTPKSVEELQEIVAGSTKIKALGKRHSFNDIADTEGNQVSLEHLSRVLELGGNTVTVEGGATYGHLCAFLAGEHRALHNLASLPHVSVAGACATATHGSGVRNGNLATAVRAIEWVKADGNLISMKVGDPEFEGAVVSLGALGVVTKLTLSVSPEFQIWQRVYDRLPIHELTANLDEILGCAYSVSLFTDWRTDWLNQVWIKDTSRDKASPRFFGAVAAPIHRHPIGDLSPENCTPQMNEPGLWHDRLPHFKQSHTPSSSEELQSEYLLPREHALEAILAIDSIREQIAPHLQISEIRTVAADDLWMSPCYQQDCVAIHFTWKKDWPSVRALLPVLESHLAQFRAKPHWGKLFHESQSRLYPRLADFKGLAKRCDPVGKFMNSYLRRSVFPARL